MGGDGGTIISRRNCMRFNNKKKGKEISRDMERTHKWLHCALSQERLKKPIVGCRLGRLYNKDRLLEFLLDKSSRGVLDMMLIGYGCLKNGKVPRSGYDNHKC